MAENQVNSIDDLLFQIQDYTDEYGQSYPQLVHLLPSDDQIIDIDLNKRLIDAPEILSVWYDHNAEVIYFRCNRYYDNMDLTNTICIIQYKNAPHKMNENSRINVRDDGLYWVPYYDVYHYKEDEETGVPVPQILIPWAVGGLATAYPGKIEYAVRFYKLSNDGTEYLYNMSTQVAEGAILHGMEAIDKLAAYKIDTTEVERIYSAIAQAKDDTATYWMDMYN